MKRQKKSIIITAVAVCLLAALFFAVIFMIQSAVSAGGAPNRTTDTWSHAFSNVDEKLAFLAEYLIMPSEASDAAYHIAYFDNSTGMIPGPSDYDVRVALKVKPEDIPLWTEGFEAVSPDDIDITWWDGIALEGISWHGAAEYYKREGEFSYLVAFPEGGVILKAVSTMGYAADSANAAKSAGEIAGELKYPIMMKAYTDPDFLCPVMMNAEQGGSHARTLGTYEEMLESLEDDVLYAPPHLGDFDRDGVYECIYTAAKWDAPDTYWYETLYTKDEFLQGIERLESGLEIVTGNKGIIATELQGEIHPDLPGFTVQERKREKTEFVSAYDRLIIRGMDGSYFASIDLLDYTLWGTPTSGIPTATGKPSNIELIDVNFDGYKDIAIEDKAIGSRNIHYIYFVWDHDKGAFVHNKARSEPRLPTVEFQKKELLQQVIPAGYDIYSAKSADLNCDGIADVVALLIPSGREDDPAMTNCDLPVVIFLGNAAGKLEFYKRSDNLAYDSYYGDSTVLSVGEGWFKLCNSSGKAGGFEHNYLFAYDAAKANWILAEVAHCNDTWVYAQARIYSAADLGYLYFDDDLSVHIDRYSYEETPFGDEKGHTDFIQLSYGDEEWRNKVNRLIAEDHDTIHAYLKAQGCDGYLHTSPLFISPDVICVEYELFAVVGGITYYGQNKRYFTTIIDAKTGERLRLSDIIDIDGLAQTLSDKGFYPEYGELTHFSETVGEIAEMLKGADDLPLSLEGFGSGCFTGIQTGSICLYWQPVMWVDDAAFSDYESIKRYIPLEWIEAHIQLDLWQYERKIGEFIFWQG